MRFLDRATESVAKERLRLMIESEQSACTPEVMAIIKREIAEVVARHFDITPEDYEIKVILKEKRA